MSACSKLEREVTLVAPSAALAQLSGLGAARDDAPRSLLGQRRRALQRGSGSTCSKPAQSARVAPPRVFAVCIKGVHTSCHPGYRGSRRCSAPRIDALHARAPCASVAIWTPTNGCAPSRRASSRMSHDLGSSRATRVRARGEHDCPAVTGMSRSALRARRFVREQCSCHRASRPVGGGCVIQYRKTTGLQQRALRSCWRRRRRADGAGPC